MKKTSAQGEVRNKLETTNSGVRNVSATYSEEKMSDAVVTYEAGKPEDEESVTGSAEKGNGVEKTEQEKKKETLNEVLDWLRTICIGVLAGVFIVVFLVQRDNVHGDSMMPTLNSGDVIFTQKLSTYFDSYKRGDIVVLDGHDMEGYNHKECLIKRIVGLPGETVRIADGKVYIKPADSADFFLLQENYLPAGITTNMMADGLAKGYGEITLGEDEYFCLGDNRPVSNDSRNLGPFTEDRIKGVALFRIYPFNAMKGL